jgi:hypothetical protein
MKSVLGLSTGIGKISPVTHLVTERITEEANIPKTLSFLE